MRHGAGLIERGGKGDHAPARDGAVRRFEPGQATECGRLADRATGVSTGDSRCQAGRHGSGRTTRRTAGHAVGIPGVAHGPVVRGFVRRAHGELVHVEFAQRDEAGLIAAFDDGGVIGCDEVFQHARTAGGAPAVLAEDVFVGDRYASEWAGLACGTGGIGGFGSRARLFFVNGDKSVDGGVVLGDTAEEQIGQFQAGNLFGFERAGKFFEAGVNHSITLGTR